MNKPDTVPVADDLKNRTRIWLMLRAAQRTALPERDAICEFIGWEKSPARARARAAMSTTRA
ncbi:hypothetical protein [Noviherbaspirillum denitrificans]|uniref:Uncharacterized protein n=1 Tax=Noviherbaspirillum denitrificans TaxID=1968433 RepID=A0A254TCS9_9BURK|nr:hypothetical protein [Noviherbaspirillum denitrificans]OWW20450.1 hypothetical protein AYR66_14095 [Noviherbaspirillum denitrificans]